MKKLLGYRGGKKLFLQAYIIMSLIRLGLLLLPFSRLQNLIAKSQEWSFLAIASSEVTTRAIALALDRSSKYQPGNPMCLARALTSAVLMGIYSLPYQINIGVAKGENDQIEAHAWVVSAGVVIVGNLPDLSRYTPMSSQGEGLII